MKIDTTRTSLEQDLPPVNTPSLGNSVSHAGYFNTETLLSKAFNLRTDDLMLSAGAISPRKLPSSPVLQEMDTDADLTTMAKFSSTLVLEHIRHMQTEGEATVQCKEFEGAAMIVDVSGFTKMCEEFSKGGGGDRNDQKSRRKTAVDTGKESEVSGWVIRVEDSVSFFTHPQHAHAGTHRQRGYLCDHVVQTQQ